MKNIFTIIVALILSACVNPINLRTAHDYFQGGLQNAKKGKWFNARMSFGRAWTNANLGKAEDRVTAVYAYEYGRASGVICDWKESERGLLKALELDQKTNGPTHMSLVELARMYHAKGSLSESEKYFAKAKRRLDELEADTKDSIGYANILNVYAKVLNELGKASEAEALTKREQEIRNVFKGRKSGHDVTPYGEHCDQKSLKRNNETDGSR
jgi:tetratricopeptide (TPR) repeat protein